MRPENLQVCQSIATHRDSLAEKIVARQYRSQPELARRCGNSGRDRCLSDVKRHLEFLAQAIAVGRSALFVDYVAWAKVALHGEKRSCRRSCDEPGCLLPGTEELAPDDAAVARQYVLDGLSCLPSLPPVAPTFFSMERPLAKLARDYLDALLRADRREANRLVMDAIGQGISVRDIYLHVFQRSQYEVGRLWQINQISVGQEHLCTAATQLNMSQLYPLIFGTERKHRRLVATCVGGDLHEIGIRMVADFFEIDGWDTFYLGADVPTESILQTVFERKPTYSQYQRRSRRVCALWPK